MKSGGLKLCNFAALVIFWSHIPISTWAAKPAHFALANAKSGVGAIAPVLNIPGNGLWGSTIFVKLLGNAPKSGEMGYFDGMQLAWERPKKMLKITRFNILRPKRAQLRLLGVSHPAKKPFIFSILSPTGRS